ncbi:hypothetical protein V8F33_010456, partial [Rhypophila sp. PSN 637]
MNAVSVLQKMIEHVTTPVQIHIIREALQHQVVELIQDLNGNHVIQKCLNKLTARDAEFIFNAVGNKGRAFPEWLAYQVTPRLALPLVDDPTRPSTRPPRSRRRYPTPTPTGMGMHLAPLPETPSPNNYHTRPIHARWRSDAGFSPDIVHVRSEAREGVTYSATGADACSCSCARRGTLPREGRGVQSQTRDRSGGTQRHAATSSIAQSRQSVGHGFEPHGSSGDSGTVNCSSREATGYRDQGGWCGLRDLQALQAS